MTPQSLRKGALLFLLSLTSLFAACNEASLEQSEFRSALPPVAELSLQFGEEAGYFDTDNLISNEDSYQHVVPELARLASHSGAYLGVGPGQNFTYIAHLKPDLAFIVDIRRDNLLVMLYLKLLFEHAGNRWEYLSALIGRPLPKEFQPDDSATVQDLVNLFHLLPPQPDASDHHFDRIAGELEKSFPTLIRDGDIGRMRRLLMPFIEEGLRLRFRSHGRPPRYHYPSFEELLLQRDREGRLQHFLNREEDFQTLRKMHLTDRIIPVVCNLGGDRALKRIAAFLRERGIPLSVFYTSNVEYYLLRQGLFGKYIENLMEFPIDDDSLLVRSYFGHGDQIPDSVPGYFSTSFTQPITDLLDEQSRRPITSYRDLVYRSQQSLLRY